MHGWMSDSMATRLARSRPRAEKHAREAIADGITLMRLAMRAFGKVDPAHALEPTSPGMNQSPSRQEKAC